MRGSGYLHWSDAMPDRHHQIGTEPTLSEMLRVRTPWPSGNGAVFNTKAPRPPFGYVGLGVGRIRQPVALANSLTLRQASVLPGMFDALVKTCQRWRLEERSHATLLGYKDYEFLGQQLLRGYVPPRTQDVRDRIGYVLAISLGLGALFNEDAEAELSWLTAEHPLLKTSPLDFMLRGRMINLITVADIVRAERAL
jgi:hypothetical protein